LNSIRTKFLGPSPDILISLGMTIITLIQKKILTHKACPEAQKVAATEPLTLPLTDEQ
jgi:hypothetical protein